MAIEKEYTEDELQDLTDEERAALEDDEEEAGSDDAGTDADDNDGSAETDADANAEDGDQGSDDAGAAAEEPAAATEADKGAETDKATRSSEEITPTLLNGDLPEDIDQKLTEIADQKKSLDDQFDDGDLTSKEYRAEMDKLNKQEREIEQQQFKSQLASEMAENNQRNAWKKTVQDFLDDHKEYAPGSIRHRALDTEVRRIAADEENASLSGAEILAKAHENITSEFGGNAQQTEEEDKDNGKDKDKDKKEYKPEVPPNLARTPSAEITETGNNKFKQLDRLMDEDPMAYEEALAKMSETEQERYLASQ